MSINEAAREVPCHPRILWGWRDEGTLPAFHVGNRHLVFWDDVLRAIRKHRVVKHKDHVDHVRATSRSRAFRDGAANTSSSRRANAARAPAAPTGSR